MNLDLLRIFFVGIAIAACWFKVWEPYASFSLIGIIATVFGGLPIYKEALHALQRRQMNMELSMTIALIGAICISELFTALLIVFFVLIAEELEKLTVAQGRRHIRELLSYLPPMATVILDGAITERALAQIHIGDLVVIKPGAHIPVDGIVVSGNSFVDQSTITGESMPAEKMPGHYVYAGTVNQAGVLEVKTDRVGLDTAFGKIIYAVERAEAMKAPVELLSDKLAGYLIYISLSCALLTFLATHNMRSTISVILVAGACGVAAGTPLAILGGIGQAAKAGCIVKGGLYLEQLARASTIVLDKTGTITSGSPEIVEIIPSAKFTAEDVLRAASTAEFLSEHPFAKAIVTRAQSQGLHVKAPDHFSYTPGKGIACQSGSQHILVGNRALFANVGMTVNSLVDAPSHLSEVLVAVDGTTYGAIYLADPIREEAENALKRMRALHLKSVLLTGDRNDIAVAIGKQLGIDETYAQLLPEQKAAQIQELEKHGQIVAMIGDGINDAAALITASVGVAIGSGTDVARESADVVLIGNDLNRFVDTLQIARRCRNIIFTNFFGTIVVDGIGMLFAANGLLPPLPAALIHVGSELIFILNSARLLRS